MPKSKHRKGHKQKVAQRKQKIVAAKEAYNRQIMKVMGQIEAERQNKLSIGPNQISDNQISDNQISENTITSENSNELPTL